MKSSYLKFICNCFLMQKVYMYCLKFEFVQHDVRVCVV